LNFFKNSEIFLHSRIGFVEERLIAKVILLILKQKSGKLDPQTVLACFSKILENESRDLVKFVCKILENEVKICVS